jgi:hypothetical protein
LAQHEIQQHTALSFFGGKFIRHRQRATLVGLQGNLLCQHDVARDKRSVGHKTPASSRAAGVINLVDVHRGAMAYPVSPTAVTAGDVEIALRVILR